MALEVIVAEDNFLVREGVRRLLDDVEGIEVTAVCADLDELLAAVSAAPPHVVVTDVRMPPTSTDEGIRAADGFRASHPHVGVVVLSQHDEAEYALRLLELGSGGRAYLLKDTLADRNQLVTAIREVARGGSVIDARVVDALVADRTRDARSPLATLTARERDVLTYMARGHNNEGIARTLHLSIRVVEKYINTLFAKLGLGDQPDVHRRVAAVLIYLAEVGG